MIPEIDEQCYVSRIIALDKLIDKEFDACVTHPNRSTAVLEHLKQLKQKHVQMLQEIRDGQR